MAIVAISKCSSYESKIISDSLEKILSSIGGIDALLKGKVKVFIKVNLLSPFSPVEKAIYTHPVFVREVIAYLKNWNIKIFIGDDLDARRGDPFVACGLRSALADLDVELSNLKEKGFEEVKINGEAMEKIHIARQALEADIIIDLPKLKTHSFTIYTGAIKNMFGLIPHGLRLKCHREHIWNEDFSRALVDIFAFRQPDLTIMDAIIAMEGEGPSSGNPRPVNLVLAARDAVALDAVAGKIIGLEPDHVFTTWLAYLRGLGAGKLEAIEIKGEALNEVRVPDFKPSTVAAHLFRRYLPSFLYAYFQNQLAFSPEIKKDICTGCADCWRACPARAIKMSKNIAWIDESRCIHCLCCHEVCAHNSVLLKQRPMGRAIRLASRLWNRTRFLIS